MRVKIGPYLRWWGPYQIANLLLGNPKETYDWTTGQPETKRLQWADKLGDWLASTKFADLCQWIHDRRKRNVYVRIDNYDVWNMDETLRLIIGPMLVKLRENKHGSGFVDDCDVPAELRATSAPAVDEWHSDGNMHKRYDWLLDELVWAFTADHEAAMHKFYDYSAVSKHSSVEAQIKSMRVDRAGVDAYQARLQRAYCLFGKYYQTLWD